MTKRILVATDFSTRSDRAIRRATILARTLGASLTLVHVVDDDQPQRLVETERNIAQSLLDELVESLRRIDHVKCDGLVLSGNVSTAIAKANEDLQPDLLITGPHRHQGLMDIFAGTTAERIIRVSHHPVLMAGGVPSGVYRHILIAVDLSACSVDALQAVKEMRLDQETAVSIVHVFDAPAATMMRRAGATDASVKDYIMERQLAASRELDAFLQAQHITPVGKFLRPDQSSVATVLSELAREISADLLVVGTRGKTGIRKLLLGSVAEQVLRDTDRDVLAIPLRDRR